MTATCLPKVGIQATSPYAILQSAPKSELNLGSLVDR